MLLQITVRLKQLKYYVNMGLILTRQIKLVSILLFCCLIFLCEFFMCYILILLCKSIHKSISTKIFGAPCYICVHAILPP